MFRPIIACLAAAFMVLFASPGSAADIRVYTSGAPASVQKTIAPAFEAATGHHLIVTVGTLAAITERAAVENPDLMVLAKPALDSLERRGKLRPGSRVDLARVGIGVAVRAGSPMPDVSSVDAVRKLLLDAKSIVHPDPHGGGITGAHIARMFERMGIADAVKSKVKYMFAIGGGVAAVAKGDIEVGLFNVSEILPVPGVAMAGRLPADLQNYITFSGAVHSAGASPEAATAFLQRLMQEDARDAWIKGGMEPLGR